MNCCKCQKRVRTPHHDYAVADMVAMCRKHCLACNPLEMSRGGNSQVEATDFTLSKRMHDPAADAPLGQLQADTDIVGVSPDAFDRLRKAMTALFALAPLDLLIVQHMFNGGRMSEFPEVYKALMCKCQRYHGSARQMVRARKMGIEAKMPQLAPVLGRIIKDGGTRRMTDE